MDLQLSISGKCDTTRQIYRQLCDRILDGRLPSGSRLPASRELADELAIARKTVTNVYDLLLSEGFLEARPGSGTFVADVIARNRGLSVPPISAISLEHGEAWAHPLERAYREVAYDFDVGVPDVSQFPFPLWRSLIAARARLLTQNAARYAEPQGFPPLRLAIAKYTAFTRAVVCDEKDIVVTNGAQHAFDLISRVLIRPGSVVAMEHPGYDRARRLFEMHGATIDEILVDGEGMIVERLSARTRIVYVTPSHQFPTGVVMSLARRIQLLEWAARHGVAIIEDDYDSEFRFAARPLDSLQSLDRNGVVLYVGTFSKVLFPGVRIGFVVAPEPIRGSIIAARELTDWHGPLLMEATLARFIDEGHLARHIRKMRRIYGGRRSTLLKAIELELSGFLTTLPGTAGLHIGTRLSGGYAVALAAEALESGVRVTPFCPEGLAIGYGLIDEARIAEGVTALAEIIRK